jgi:hypothetical protein
MLSQLFDTTVQATTFSSPKLVLTLLSAVLSALNPCTIGIFVLLVTTVLGTGKAMGRLLVLGIYFICSLFVTNVLLGIALLYGYTIASSIIGECTAITIAILAILSGLLQVKDYFWYGHGFSLRISDNFVTKIQKYIVRQMNPGTVIILGALIAILELPCSGTPYLATVSILHNQFDLPAFYLVILYNLIFVAPLVYILLRLTDRIKLAAIKQWKEKYKDTIRLAIGLLAIALGWILLLVANGSINFG